MASSNLPESKLMKPLVIYHKNCLDGFGAAWAAYCYFDDKKIEAEYLALDYDDKSFKIEDGVLQAPVELACRTIYIFDFSFPIDVHREIEKQAEQVFWLDHHKTAFDKLGVPYDRKYEARSQKGLTILDPHTSGCMLAWQFFFPNYYIPYTLELIQDRDLWKWAYPDTKDFCAGLASRPLTFENFTQASYNVEDVITEGKILNTSNSKALADLVELAIPVHIEDFPHQGLAVNSTPKLTSELGSLLAETVDFGMVWFLEPTGMVKVSLRSKKGFDVEAVCKRFGGGGHPTAAGFRTRLENLVFKDGELYLYKDMPKPSIEDLAEKLGFNLNSLVKVKDGYVPLNGNVWWKDEDGPKPVSVSHHLRNIKEFPELYSRAEPKYRLVYED